MGEDEPAAARRSQVQGQGAADAADARHQHRGVPEAKLAGFAEAFTPELPLVDGAFFVGKGVLIGHEDVIHQPPDMGARIVTASPSASGRARSACSSATKNKSDLRGSPVSSRSKARNATSWRSAS